jgi:hypothetical protein
MSARSQTYRIVEGTTEPQDFQLKDDDENLVGTGLTLGIVVYNNGTAVSGITAAWLDQTNGTARVSGIGTLEAGEYAVRFTLTDTGSKVGFVPGGQKVMEADRWIITRAYA